MHLEASGFGSCREESLKGRIQSRVILIAATVAILSGSLISAGQAAGLSAGSLFLSADEIDGSDLPFLVNPQWRFHGGDDVRWADPNFDDHDWEILDTRLPDTDAAKERWTGIGWFRLHLNFDPDLWGRSLSVQLMHTGACEVYFDGQKVASHGVVGRDREEEKNYLTHEWLEVERLGVAGSGPHVIAVRYSNQNRVMHFPLTDRVGFDFALGDYEIQKERSTSRYNLWRKRQIVFTTATLVFTFLHLLLFLFYRPIRENLYYSILTLSCAGLSFFPIQGSVTHDLQSFQVMEGFFKLSLLLIGVSGSLLLHSVFDKRLPMRFWVLSAAAFLMAIAIPVLDIPYFYAFTFVAMSNMLWVTGLAVKRRSRGCYLFAAGFGLFLGLSAYQILLQMEVVRELVPSFDFPYLVGILALLVFMSIGMAREVGNMNKRLQLRLKQVEELSAKTLEQERQAKEREMERALLEKEVAHQAEQLEKARELEKALQEVERANEELRSTQAQLIQSEKMASLGSLVAGVAHEINTPVGAIHSMQTTLVKAVKKLKTVLREQYGDGWEKDTTGQQVLGIIDEASNVIGCGSERVTEIVRRLRSFARLDEAELKTADIHEGIDDTLTMVHHELKHNIEVVRELGDLPLVRCYPSKLNQVFLNLVVNAVQAIEGKGKITIRTSADESRIRVEISDTGRGIPEDKLSRIFDPGFTTKGVGVGTGLGLSICYQIIKEHQGKISVASEPGQGATFTVEIPRS